MSGPAAQQARTKMDQAIAHFVQQLGSVRTGRASVTLLDGIMVDYYGTPKPLKQVASLSTPDSRQLTIQPWEPALIPAIEKALLGSTLGLTPNNDGTVIRLSLPPLTEERRKELVKVVRKMGEDAKVIIRNLRRDANDGLKQTKGAPLSEDALRAAQQEIQKLTDQASVKIDDAVKKKEKEVLEF
ncbi:MAG: ribosome recycling factor [Nitrospirae bacterium]|nr:ribosome recycling factor [Nitrospirota bacterium]